MKRHRQFHGGTHTRLYTIWTGMRRRTLGAAKVKEQRWYKDRGITICDEWRDDFAAFRDWALANGYSDSLTIDRFPDPEGDYQPGNCRWATRLQQSRNSSWPRPVLRNDGKHYDTISDAAIDVGSHVSVICGACRGRNKTAGGYGWSYGEFA